MGYNNACNLLLEPSLADAATLMIVFIIRSYMAKQGMVETRRASIHIVAWMDADI